MAKMTPEQEALYALQWNLPRSDLSTAVQLEYDRLKPVWEREAARLAWERAHPYQQRGASPVARPVTGDEVRDTTFMFGRRDGYDRAQVDDLLCRLAAEIDAGRPVEPLIENATFRDHTWTGGYDTEAVDWFLEQLRLDHRDLAGMSQDPWRDLAVTAQITRSEIGHLAGAHTWLAQKALWRYYSEECLSLNPPRK